MLRHCFRDTKIGTRDTLQRTATHCNTLLLSRHGSRYTWHFNAFKGMERHRGTCDTLMRYSAHEQDLPPRNKHQALTNEILRAVSLDPWSTENSYHKSHVILEKPIWRLIHSAGTKDQFYWQSNDFASLFPKNPVAQSHCSVDSSVWGPQSMWDSQ